MVIEMAPIEVTTDFVSTAEKELAAFVGAVSELFGTGQAEQAAEDWIRELEELDYLDEDEMPDWRQLTIAAAGRLANRACRRIQILAANS